MERLRLKIAGWGLVLLSFCLLCGCTDNPDDKAAKAAQETTCKALASVGRIGSDGVTAEQLRKQIEAALRNSRATGMTQDAAILSAANLRFLEIRQSCADMRLELAVSGKSLGPLGARIRRLGQTKTDAERIEKLIAAGEKEIAEISDWIGSEEEPNSLTGKLVPAQSEVEKLRLQKAELEKKKTQAEESLADIQARADEKIRLSEQARGTEREVLQKEGFDLLLEKKSLFLSMQETVNLLEAVDGQLCIAEPAALRLEKDLAAAQDKLKDLKNSPSRGLLVSQKDSLGQEYAEQSKAIEESAAAIGAQVGELSTKVMDILAGADEMAGQYQKIRSRGLEPTVSLLLGEAYLQSGLLCGGLVIAKMELGSRLDGIISSEGQAAGLEKLKDMVNVSPSPDKGLAGRATEYFDKSEQSYDKAFPSANQLGREAGCSALKGQILAVNSKIRLCDRIGDYEAADASQGRLDVLFEKGKEFGTVFSRSETVLMVQQGLGYSPFLPVDMSMAIENVRKEFGQWRALRGAKQEEAVNGLLVRVQELLGEYPDEQEMGSFLGQEKTALEDAKKRGFEEAVADANSLL